MLDENLQKTYEKNKGKQILLLKFYLFITSVEAFATFGYTLNIPTDPTNSIFLGYSLPRLITAGVLLSVGVFFAVLGFLSFRNPSRTKSIWEGVIKDHHRLEAIIFISAIIFFTLIITAVTPGYRFGQYSAYFERIFPFLIWLNLVSAQTLLPALILRFGWDSENLKAHLKIEKRGVITSAAVFGILAVIWIFMFTTRIGIQPDKLHWYDNGVPVLIPQIMLACGIGLLVRLIYTFFRKNHFRFDLLVFLVFWIAAALVWHFQPQQSSYFAPGPYPPNFEFYPYSDAVRYDIAAQNALMGSGYNNPYCPDKPLLLTLFTFLHIVGGLDQESVIIWLVAILAMYPAVIFLLGKELQCRSGGAIAAVLVIAKEANAISAAHIISTSNSKLMLSEVPQALLLVLAVLFFVRWIKHPENRTHYIILVGGILGLSILLRLNTILLGPAACAMIPFALGKRWKTWFKPGVLLLIMVGVSLIPWMWRVQVVCNKSTFSPFSFITAPINTSVIKNRYRTYFHITPSPVSQTSQGSNNTNIPDDDPSNPEKKTPIKSSPTTPGKFDEAKTFIPGHFFHNISSNLLVLPLSLSNDDLYHTIKQPGSVWANSPSWNGQLEFTSACLLIINMVFLSLGIGFAWSHWKIAGISPLILILAYYFSTAVARTSGGRYLVPGDWGLILYYSLGLWQVQLWLIHALGFRNDGGSTYLDHQNNSINIPKVFSGKNWRLLSAVLIILAISISIPLTEMLFPNYESVVPYETTYDQILESGVIQNSGFDIPEIDAFINQGGVILSGRALYPRFFKYNEGMVDEEKIFSDRAYPRSVFMLTKPDAPQEGVILPMEKSPEFFPNGSDVFVFGCRSSEKLIDASMVIVLKPELHVYTRSPSAPLSCPLPEPICDNNHVCK